MPRTQHGEKRTEMEGRRREGLLRGCKALQRRKEDQTGKDDERQKKRAEGSRQHQSGKGKRQAKEHEQRSERKKSRGKRMRIRQKEKRDGTGRMQTQRVVRVVTRDKLSSFVFQCEHGRREGGRGKARRKKREAEEREREENCSNSTSE